MSRRRIEQGIYAPSSFSLRTITTGGPSIGVVAPARPYSAGGPPPVPSQASLSFKFDSLVADTPRVAASVKATLPTATLPSNFFSRQTVASKESADTMRLTAVVDELTQRLRKMSDAKTTAETQLARISQALTNERSANGSKMQAMKSEMSTVQDQAMSLRSELAQRPAMREVDPAKFGARVRSALEQEETNAKVADAESRVGMLLKRAEGLTAEVKLLEGRKHDKLAEANAALTEEEIDVLVHRAAEAQTLLSAAEEQKESIQDSIDRLTAMRDSHRADTVVAAAEMEAANRATTTAVADSHAARRQVKDLLIEHEEVAASLEAKRVEISALGKAHPAEYTVTGAQAPARRDPCIATTAAQVDNLSCCSTGVPYHFAHDAPINIASMASTGATFGEDDMNGMVNALVTDLKSYFQFAAADHAKIGRTEIAATMGAVETAA